MTTALAAQLEVIELAVTELVPGFDFRLDDNVEDVTELAKSIAEHGVLQPLRRRLSAARQAGLDVVPCVARPLTDDEATDAALAENIHRRNRTLAPVDRRRAGRRRRGRSRVVLARRRHDRVLGGLYAIQKARPVDADEILRMIDRLIKLDTQPFPEVAAS